MSRVRQLYLRVEQLVHELLKFGIVGSIAFVIDVGLFNLLRFAGSDGPLQDKPLTAKTISVVVATTFAYFANRNWTYRHRARTGLAREYVLFFAFNAIGLALALACLGISHYLLGLTSPLADNISANVVGMGLATTFRFLAYRTWVFPRMVEPVGAASAALPQR